MKKRFNKIYSEWRKTGEDAVEGTNTIFTWDCGEKVREKILQNMRN